MKKVKRVIVILLVVGMIFGLLAGCEKKNGKDEPTGTNAQTSNKTEASNPLSEKIEISFALWGIGQAITEAPDAVREKIYNELNISIKPMNVTWDDYTQKIQIWAASSQLPDIFAIDVIGTANYKNWIEQGIVRPLPSDLSPYPQINKIMNSPGFDIYKYPIGDPNGKIYAIPRLNHLDIDDWSCDTGIHLRKDWMQNVGITKEPENMDEFIALMKAFVENDPDKNNKKDTIGLTCYNSDWLTWFFLGYEPGIQSGGWVRDKENPGKWIPAFMTKDCLTGMKELKRLYDAGGLDRDLATLKGEEGRDKFAAGKAGAYAHDVTPSTLGYVQTQFEKVNENIKYKDIVTILKPFKHSDGNYYRHISNPAWSETYINAKCDDKKTDRVMRLFDYVLDEEGYNLIHFGIEGKEWHKEDGKIVLTPQKDGEGKDIPLSVSYPFVKCGFIAEWSGTRQWSAPTVNPELQKMSSDLNDWLQANAKPVPTDLRIPLLDVPSKDKATARTGEIIIKCLLSDNVEKTWNEIVSSYRANGYDKLIEEINEACAKANIK
ncbi:MAG TPA: extracellular solute-binding protein [Clostridiales bacterium]|nr:extracellular solute-binding protein [Clostridiales bacterium]